MVENKIQEAPSLLLEKLIADLQLSRRRLEQILTDQKEGAILENEAQVLVIYYNEKISKLQAEIDALSRP